MEGREWHTCAEDVLACIRGMPEALEASALQMLHEGYEGRNWLLLLQKKNRKFSEDWFES